MRAPVELELTAPHGAHVSHRRQRHFWTAGTASVLLGVTLVAVLALSGSGGRRSVLSEALPLNDEEVDITTEDVNQANAEVNADLHALQTEQAGHVRGSMPTDEVEASAIVGDMDHYVRSMGDKFGDVTSSHSDDQAEADRIIDIANKEGVDTTGKSGATIYEAVSDASLPHTAFLRGSIPNYRAESAYIVSGVDGNYEKELENAPTMSVVGGKVPAREVAYRIIDEAYKDKTSPDCTGTVDKDGVHGVGKGTPPCSATVAFKKPKNMAGSHLVSKVFVNISLDMTQSDHVYASQNALAGGMCNDATKAHVRSALAEAAGVGSADVILASDAVVEEEGAGDGAGDGSGAVIHDASDTVSAEKATRTSLLKKSAEKIRAVAEQAAKKQAKAEARVAFRSGVLAGAQQNLVAEVQKVEGQLAKLQRSGQKPTTNLAAAEASALKGDSLFERKLAAASLQLEMSQHKLLQKAAKWKVAESSSETAAAKYRAEKAELLNKQEPFYWLRTPSSDEKAKPVELQQAHKRRLLQVAPGASRSDIDTPECKYYATILVPTSESRDAAYECQQKIDILLVNRGLMPALKVTTSILDLPGPEPSARLVDCNEDSCCRIEILHDDEWGTVCDDSDSDNGASIAAVACRQAGCPGLGTMQMSFGGGEGKIWLDDVECMGGEPELADCKVSEWNDSDCDHSEDMGICCADGCTGPL